MKIEHTFVVLAYKKSEYLEDCIKSVINQSYKSKVVLATSTPNNYINEIANKYKLDIYINKGKKGIGADFDYALNCIKSTLVTIAHQDDIYDYSYSENIVKAYFKNENCSIYFSDYYELKNNNKVYLNLNLLIKKILLQPINLLGKFKIFRRLSLSFGCAICCPAVTFNQKKLKMPLFDCDFVCNVDWNAWEILSRYNLGFNFISKPLMGHRVHENSTTSDIIAQNIRTKEDLVMFNKFWPNWVSSRITKFYKLSEKSNSNK